MEQTLETNAALLLNGITRSTPEFNAVLVKYR
jgi:hypothetical protein